MPVIIALFRDVSPRTFTCIYSRLPSSDVEQDVFMACSRETFTLYYKRNEDKVGERIVHGVDKHKVVQI